MYDTREYVGSAFLILDSNYICHFLNVEGKARPPDNQLLFDAVCECGETQGVQSIADSLNLGFKCQFQVNQTLIFFILGHFGKIILFSSCV